MTATRSAIPEWFDADSTKLLGRRCADCHAVFFPPTISTCRNPGCQGERLEPHPLATRGRVWSWTRNHYQPPPPFVITGEFQPYVVVAVELAQDGMVVLGQLSPHSAPVDVGDTVSLRTEPLLEDEDGVALIWRWSVEESKTEEVRA
ncbi:MAG: Zn-ribbon domain-containing OB-fold protein [Sciscionella sp.]